MGVRALLVAVGLTAGLVAGCAGGDDDDPPAATVPSGSQASAEPSTTTTVGVDEVPEEITVEYVQRVMDALDASWGDMYRLYVESGGPTAETAAWLAALYTPDEARVMDVELGREAADGFDDTRRETGDPETRVAEVLSAGADCVYFVGDRHYAEIFDFTTQPDANRSALALRRSTLRPSKHNPTIWQIALELDASGGDPSEDLCVDG